MLKSYVTEFIGTFFLTLTVGMTVTSGTPFAPLAIGSSLMIMVYMGGPISGGHFNPAVSLAVFLRGKLAGKDLGPYMVSQLFGAFVAALAVHYLSGQSFAPNPGPNVIWQQSLIAEFLFTFALALVVLNTATSSKSAGNSYFGLAIGFTVVVGALAVGGISGGAFNPAIGTGPALARYAFDGAAPVNMWLHVVGPFLGGAAAAYVFKFQNPGD